MSAEWLHWYYLIYWLPAAVAVLLLLMTGLGGHQGGHSHGGLHLHAHPGAAHASAGAGHAPHTVGGHSASHPATGAAGAHAAAHGHAASHPHPADRSTPGVGQQLLGFLGVGRAPLTIAAGSLLMGWGFFGLAVTDMLQHGLHLPPTLFVGPALGAAAVGGLLSARLFGELAARLLPKDESCAIAREGLLGLTGKVVYPVSETGGRVHVYDQFRTLHVEPARVSPGDAPIEKGTEIIVASMDPDRGHLIVEPLGFSRTRIPSQSSAGTAEDQVQARYREN